MKRVRTVFGRRRVEFGGKTYLLELRRDGLVVRRLHSRNGAAVVPLPCLIEQYVIRQNELNLQSHDLR